MTRWVTGLLALVADGGLAGSRTNAQHAAEALRARREEAEEAFRWSADELVAHAAHGQQVLGA